MKRIILFPVMLLACVCINAYAASGPVISLEEKESASSEEICIDVQISENSKACGGKIDISYDNTLLKPEKYEIAAPFLNGMFLVNLNYKDNLIRLTWAGTDEVTDGGSMCTITFSIAASKSFTSTVDVSYVKLADSNSEAMAVETIGCDISYTKKVNITTSSGFGGASSNTSDNKDNNNEEEKEKNEEVVAEEKTVMMFDDVAESDWYYEAVKFAFGKGITKGVSETLYAPNSKVTRGQFITMLCRAYGIEEMTGDNFDDCGNTWYTGYLAAAKQLGISKGIGNNSFAPEKEITREEMVTLIYNYLSYAGKVDVKINETSFADNDTISEWAKKSVAFAAEKGFVKGRGNNLFEPKGNATRAELAQIFFNILGNK